MRLCLAGLGHLISYLQWLAGSLTPHSIGLQQRGNVPCNGAYPSISWMLLCAGVGTDEDDYCGLMEGTAAQCVNRVKEVGRFWTIVHFIVDHWLGGRMQTQMQMQHHSCSVS